MYVQIFYILPYIIVIERGRDTEGEEVFLGSGINKKRRKEGRQHRRHEERRKEERQDRRHEERRKEGRQDRRQEEKRKKGRQDRRHEEKGRGKRMRNSPGEAGGGWGRVCLKYVRIIPLEELSKQY